MAARELRMQARPWALVGLAAGALLLPRWALGTLFNDGRVYLTVARHLAADGLGALWHLRYTETLHPAFHEHPPLGIWCTAWALWATGGAAWAAQAVSALWLVALVALTAVLWRDAGGSRRAAFWPCLLLLGCPTLTWAAANHMLDLPCAVGCAAAVAAWRRATTRPHAAAAWGAAAGLALAAALLSKGPGALFVALAPLCLPRPAGARVARAATAAAATLAAVAAACLCCAAARAMLEAYGSGQVMASLAAQRERVPHRGRFILQLLGDLALPAALALLARGIAPRRAAPLAPATGPTQRHCHGWLLLALAATLPWACAPKQHAWYAIPALPYFALALASASRAGAAALADRLAALSPRALALCCVGSLAAIAAVTLTARARPPRDAALRADLDPVPFAAGATIVACDDALWTDWPLHAYLAARADMSLQRPAGGAGAAHGPHWRLARVGAACAHIAGCRAIGPRAPECYRAWRCLGPLRE